MSELIYPCNGCQATDTVDCDCNDGESNAPNENVEYEDSEGEPSWLTS